MGKKKPKFYVVWEGRRPGVYNNWSECQMQIQGYSGARYKSFPSKAAAEEAFEGESYEYIGQSATKPAKQARPTQTALFNTDDGPITPSLSVDAACSGNPGVMEYRGVDTETGAELFHFGPFQRATNNIGEFLGLAHGLKLLHEQGDPKPIYTDSKTAMAWIRRQQPNTTLERTPANDDVFLLIEDAVAWLKDHPYTTKILKWDTVNWGEIPADFGRK